MAYPPSGRSPYRARRLRSSLVVEANSRTSRPGGGAAALDGPTTFRSSGCEITVGVPSGAEVGALSTAEGDRGQPVRPNGAAEPLTVPREAAGSGLRGSALAIRQVVDSNRYWVDVLISGSSKHSHHIRLEMGSIVRCWARTAVSTRSGRVPRP